MALKNVCIELTPKMCASLSCVTSWQRRKVSIPHLPRSNVFETAEAAQKLKAMGALPIPHIAAREVQSKEELMRILEISSPRELLLVGGGAEKATGPYESTLDLLQNGFLDEINLDEIMVAAHPEGSPIMSTSEALEILVQKAAFARSKAIGLSAVTQVVFDTAVIKDWLLNSSSKLGETKIILGIPGPTPVDLLQKYAKICGVGPSAAKLALYASQSQSQPNDKSGTTPKDSNSDKDAAECEIWSPEPMLRELLTLSEDYGGLLKNLAGVHVYAFGGIERTLEFARKIEDLNWMEKQ